MKPVQPEVKIRNKWHKVISIIWNSRGEVVRVYTEPVIKPWGPFYDIEDPEELKDLEFR